MANTAISFEQILNATVGMLRVSWKTKICVFLQLNDHGKMQARAADGIDLKQIETQEVDPFNGAFADCFKNNKQVEVTDLGQLGELAPLLRSYLQQGEKIVLAPVTGETRVLGFLLLGPFPVATDIGSREAELRSAGALCAVLSAHWRLYQWVESIVPQLNHSLRTPLTAVQGSIGMVLGGVFGQVGNEVKEMLEMAQKGCEKTVRAIEDYINSQQIPKK